MGPRVKMRLSAAAALLGCCATAVALRTARVEETARALRERPFLRCGGIQRLLQGDINGDGRIEVVTLNHDFSAGGHIPDLVLYVLTPRGRGRLEIARKVLLGEMLSVDPQNDPWLQDVTGEGPPEVIVPAVGFTYTQLSVLSVRDRACRARLLYGHPVSGRAELVARRGDRPSRIVEHWDVWHLMGGNVPSALRGHVLARRTYEWDRRAQKYVLKSTEPDVEAERALTPAELCQVPGAEHLLKRTSER